MWTPFSQDLSDILGHLLDLRILAGEFVVVVGLESAETKSVQWRMQGGIGPPSHMGCIAQSVERQLTNCRPIPQSHGSIGADRFAPGTVANVLDSHDIDAVQDAGLSVARGNRRRDLRANPELDLEVAAIVQPGAVERDRVQGGRRKQPEQLLSQRRVGLLADASCQGGVSTRQMDLELVARFCDFVCRRE